MKGGRSKADASKKPDTKASTKRKGVEKPIRAPAKKGKAGKDPNKPKRPPSAFFVFMEEFRQEYKEAHPDNKQVSAVSKAGGDKWKKMSEADKEPYVKQAAKRKADYTKTMAAYNKKRASGGDDAGEDESDKSKSEVHDEDDEEGESGEEDEEDDE